MLGEIQELAFAETLGQATWATNVHRLYITGSMRNAVFLHAFDRGLFTSKQSRRLT
jgi:hypothetical protein